MTNNQGGPASRVWGNSNVCPGRHSLQYCPLDEWAWQPRNINALGLVSIYTAW